MPANPLTVPCAARVLVAGDQSADIEAVRQALGEHVTDLSTARGLSADVVVLAFDSLATSTACAEALVRAAGTASPPPWRIVVCAGAEREAAFAACLANDFDDYVPFWRGPADPGRIIIAVRNAARQAQAASLAPGSAVAGTQRPAPAVSDEARPVVLVVEDDPMAVRLIGEALKGEAFELRIAMNAGAAQEMLRTLRPAVVLMDIGLPGMDGLALTEWLKGRPELAQIPVVMLTGEARRETIERSREVQAEGFIVKPFTRQGLLVKLHPLLQRAQARRRLERDAP